RLWLLQLDWDAQLPDDFCNDWKVFYDGLPALNSFSIPRWIGYSPDAETCELHGFSDASESAYAAVLYLRICLPGCTPQVALLCSRTKVAPIKSLSIPRLELCGAVLLARLVKFATRIDAFANVPICCWSDATIVLHWLRDHLTRWKTFVANRVSEVQT
ncbi:hypothetical protein DD595_25660, partial [Enterobacter cloacae complex sp. 4DZ3-17B2]